MLNRLRARVLVSFVLSGAAVASAAGIATSAGEFSWLEELHGERAMAWVQAQNQRTYAQIKTDSRYEDNYRNALELVEKRESEGAADGALNGWVYRVQRTEVRPIGLWQRAKLDRYLSGKHQWTPFMDLDALDAKLKSEGYDYILMPYVAAKRVSECNDRGTRCLLLMVTADGVIALREIDMNRGTIADDGFRVDTKGLDSNQISVQAWVWEDHDTLLVAVSGPGMSDEGGSAGVIKRWKRGQTLEEAPVIFRSPVKTNGFLDIFSFKTAQGPGFIMHKFVYAGADGQPWAKYYWLLGSSESATALSVPRNASIVGSVGNEMIVRTDPDGSVFSISVSDMLAGKSVLKPIALSSNKDRIRVGMPVVGPQFVMVSQTQDKIETVRQFRFEGGQWRARAVAIPEGSRMLPIGVIDPHGDGSVLLKLHGPLVPITQVRIDAAGRTKTIHSEPMLFDGSKHVLEILWAKSRDGVEVPYTILRPKKLAYDGRVPTILQGYGSFGADFSLSHDSVGGRLWLEKGGAIAFAHIRGGGDLGADWVLTPLTRQLSYEDFAAVAEDLSRRRITDAKHLGIWGLSAGGTLMGIMSVQRPELFNAALISVGVLDLFRIDLDRGDGGRIVGEFGSADIPAERAVLEATSPYQHLSKLKTWFTPLIQTGTKDANVNPAFSRIFAAKAEKLGLPYLFVEFPDGVHGPGATTPQGTAEAQAVVYTYFAQRLMSAESAAPPTAHDVRGH